MRKHDVLGYEVPFDATMMIVFGGRTYVHEKDPGDGRLIYHKCERIPRADLEVDWRSCKELITSDMWRYDIAQAKWEFIKPGSAISPTTGLAVGYPASRYGHAAAIVEVPEGSEGFKRVYMYLYGGLGHACPGGVCNDVWKYEVPWAAQALFPKFPGGYWNRGNAWDKLKDCPFGGRYRHQMVGTSNQEYIYIFGGQGMGGFHSDLIRYRVVTDLWEDMRPFGRVSLTRLMYDYRGLAEFRQVSTDEYDASMDVDCRLAWRFDGRWAHCQVCHDCRLAIGRGEDGAALPPERGDFAMTKFKDPSVGEDDWLVTFGGFRSKWGAYYNEGGMHNQTGEAQGEESLSPIDRFDERYYFNDMWIYDPTANQWVERLSEGPSPSARKGHQMIARRTAGNDTQLVLFGGHQQDQQTSDVWTIDLMRDREERQWTKIDPYIWGPRPPSMSYHTMLFSEDMNLFVVFGGLHWDQTDLQVTDDQRNVDRRCFKEAQGLQDNYAGVPQDDFIQRMRELCDRDDFCCMLTSEEIVPTTIRGIRVRDSVGGLDLIAVSTLCRADCADKQFFPDFYPIMTEGVWTFSPSACMNDCSGHGVCDMSRCVCEPRWYGTDCSMLRCPGSACYVHPKTKEQFCVECSQHGRCLEGRCQCTPGWSNDDCSSVLCEGNCSSTYNETRGVCIPDFPVNQCHCLGPWSGLNCSLALCLNGCAGHGRCVDGNCMCDANFHGEDCSLFVWPLTGESSTA